VSDHLIESLSERERAALRLVGQGYTTKQIALQLGISAGRATKIIHSANQKLGVSSRIDAARVLARHENREVNIIPGITESLPDRRDPGHLPSPDAEDSQVTSLREERSAFGASDSPGDLGLPFRRQGRSGNDLTTFQRAIWVIALAAVALLGVGTLAFGLRSLSDQIILVPTEGR